MTPERLTQQSNRTARVLRPGATGPFWMSGALALTALGSAVFSFFTPGVLSGPDVTQGNLRGTALVAMLVAVPLLALALWRTSRNSAKGIVLWYGTVVYLLYQSVLFVFGTPFNSLFLLYVGMLSFGVWSLVALANATDLSALSARIDERLPVRGIAIYAIAIAVLNALVWLRTIVPATLSDIPSSFLEGSGMITNPVFVQDLAVWLPLLVFGAWRLWHRAPWGELITGAMLTMLVIEGIGVATDQWFGAVAEPGTPFASMDAVPLFLGLSAIGCIPLYFFYRNIDRPAGSRGTPDDTTSKNGGGTAPRLDRLRNR